MSDLNHHVRGVDGERNKRCVLDMDGEGKLYLYKAALLCKNEIIKRLINGTYQLAEASPMGKLFTLSYLVSFKAIIIFPRIMQNYYFPKNNAELLFSQE